MPDELSSVCCCEVAKVWAEVDNFVSNTRQAIDCIVDHPGFAAICLNPWSLRIAYRQYKDRFGGVDGELHEYVLFIYTQEFF